MEAIVGKRDSSLSVTEVHFFMELHNCVRDGLSCHNKKLSVRLFCFRCCRSASKTQEIMDDYEVI